VTISVPDEKIAASRDAFDGNFPVPRNKRLENSRPAITRGSCIPTYLTWVRYWTVSEARAYLPRVRELAECIRHAAKLRAGEAGSTNGNRAPILDAQEALEELQAGDIVFRDAMSGLLDFHAEHAAGNVGPQR